MSVFIDGIELHGYDTSNYGGLVKRPAVAALLALILTTGFLLAQEFTPPQISAARLNQIRAIIMAEDGAPAELVGNYDDAKEVKQDKDNTHQFVFARLIYNGRIPRYLKNWYTDYPKGDRQLVFALRRLTHLDVAEKQRVVAINDPSLFRYPFVYTSEPGQMMLTEEDAKIMREYLNRGGFWMLDDFWGSFEWGNMEAEMKKVFPDLEIKDIPPGHPIFNEMFPVDRLRQVPSAAYFFNPGNITWEQDGFVPECKGIWDKEGRLVVVINHNTDLGDAYQWMDLPEYPYEFSSYAYRVAVNTIVYALSH
jgi:hypothetical protein